MLCKLLYPNLIRDIWNFAFEAISQEIKENRSLYDQALSGRFHSPAGEFWLGSLSLINIFRRGMKGCPKRDKVKIVYGFEQIMPQIAYL